MVPNAREFALMGVAIGFAFWFMDSPSTSADAKASFYRGAPVAGLVGAGYLLIA